MINTAAVGAPLGFEKSMRWSQLKRAGHWPTLASAFLYFDSTSWSGRCRALVSPEHAMAGHGPAGADDIGVVNTAVPRGSSHYLQCPQTLGKMGFKNR